MKDPICNHPQVGACKWSLEVAKTYYLTKALNSKLATRLKTLVDEEGHLKVTETTSIQDTLKLLEELYVEAKLLWVQRTNYFKDGQRPNKSFHKWWLRKLVLKEQCQLPYGISSEDLDVLELLRGVSSNELRKEMQKKRTFTQTGGPRSLNTGGKRLNRSKEGHGGRRAECSGQGVTH